MDSPLVSIILTLYNGEQFVRQAIESVLSQTFQNWELVIVNDASADRSMEIVKSFHDDRFRALDLECNMQLCFAHRIGDQAAKGKYIAVIDKDDCWEETKLEKQISYMEQHPETGACFTLVNIIDESGIIDENSPMATVFNVENRSRVEWLCFLLTTGNHLCHPSVLIRKTVLEEVGGYDPLFLQLQDYDLWLRVLRKYEVYIIRERLVRYRRFEGSGSLSSYTPETHIRSLFEYTWIVGNMITSMDNEEFRSVFLDAMIHKEVSTDTEIRCEKAIILASDLFLVNLKIFAFSLFSELFRDDHAVEILKNKYGFTQHNVYKITGIPIFYDPSVENQIRIIQNELEACRNINQIYAAECLDLQIKYEESQKELSQLTEKNQQLEQNIHQIKKEIQKLSNETETISVQNQCLTDNIRLMETEKKELTSAYLDVLKSFQTIENSSFWKITSPARKILDYIKLHLK